MKTTRLVAASACLLLTVSLSSCSKETEKPRATATPSAAPTTSKPPQPRDAESAIRAWLDALIDMQNTGEPEPLLALSTQDCEFCTSFSKQVAMAYRAGGNAEVEPLRVRSINPLRGDSATKFIVHVMAGTSELNQSADSVTEVFDGGPETYLIEVREEDSLWLVSGYTPLESPQS